MKTNSNRKQATKKYISSIIIIVIVISFLVSSIDLSFLRGNDILCSFKNSKNIKIKDLSLYLNQNNENTSVEDIVNMLIRSNLEDYLIKQNNLRCSNNYLSNYLKKNLFQNDKGHFDMQQFKSALKLQNTTQKEYLDFISNVLIKQSIYKDIINQVNFTSNLESKYLESFILQQKNVDLVEVNLINAEKHIFKISEAEKRNLFEQFKNQFALPEKRNIEYFYTTLAAQKDRNEKLKTEIITNFKSNTSTEQIAKSYGSNLYKIDNIDLENFKKDYANLNCYNQAFTTAANEMVFVELPVQKRILVLQVTKIHPKEIAEYKDVEKQVISIGQKIRLVESSMLKVSDIIRENKNEIIKDNKIIRNLINKSNLQCQIQNKNIGLTTQDQVIPKELLSIIISDTNVGCITPLVLNDSKSKIYFAIVKNKFYITEPKNNPMWEKIKNNIVQTLYQNTVSELIQCLYVQEKAKINNNLIKQIQQHYDKIRDERK